MFLYDYTFENDTEKTIWELHSENVPHRKIAKQLNSKGIKISPTKVLKIIQPLVKKMIALYGTEYNK
jgi:hypothetical protein